MSLNEILHQANVTKLREAIEKRAGFWQSFTNSLSSTNMGRQIGEGIMVAGAQAAVTGLGEAARAGYTALRTKVEKPKAYQAMIEMSPGLAKKDPRAVQSTFNTLYGLNRAMAKDPLVAGSFVGKTVERAEIGGESVAYVDPQTVRMLMDTGGKGRGSSSIMDAWSSGAGRPDPYKRIGEEGMAKKTNQFSEQLAQAKRGQDRPNLPHIKLQEEVARARHALGMK
jgi:hypothetical protein